MIALINLGLIYFSKWLSSKSPVNDNKKVSTPEIAAKMLAKLKQTATYKDVDGKLMHQKTYNIKELRNLDQDINNRIHHNED